MALFSSHNMVLFSVIFIQFLLFYFPGYHVIKSKSGNIETVFWGTVSSTRHNQGFWDLWTLQMMDVVLFVVMVAWLRCQVQVLHNCYVMKCNISGIFMWIWMGNNIPFTFTGSISTAPSKAKVQNTQFGSVQTGTSLVSGTALLSKPLHDLLNNPPMFWECLCEDESVVEVDTDYSFHDQVLEDVIYHVCPITEKRFKDLLKHVKETL